MSTLVGLLIQTRERTYAKEQKEKENHFFFVRSLVLSYSLHEMKHELTSKNSYCDIRMVSACIFSREHCKKKKKEKNEKLL